MSERRFDGTDLPNSIGDQPIRQAISKSVLDLLDKINTVSSEADSATRAASDSLQSQINNLAVPIMPLSSTISSDTTYTISGSGIRLILIPKAFLVARSGPGCNLTISAGGSRSIIVPIAPVGDTITCPDLLFNIYIDSSKNVYTTPWSVSGSNSAGSWKKQYDGSMTQSGKVTKPLAGGSTISVPLAANFISTSYFPSLTPQSFGGQYFRFYIFSSGYSTSSFQFAAEATTNDQNMVWSASGSWRN